MSYNNRYQKPNYIESNTNQYEMNNYNNNGKLVNKNKNIEQGQVYRENYLVVSSKDRDLSIYPKSCKFSLDLNEEYRNIKSIQLIQAIIPDKNSVTSEPFLLLNINEIDSVMDSNNTQINKAFAMLQICQPTVSGSFLHIDNRIHENVVIVYQTPKAKLSKFTVELTTCDGVLFEFGGDSTTTKDYQCQFIFKITTIETDRNTIGQKNIYY